MLMFSTLDRIQRPGPWQAACEAELRERLGQDPTLAAYVIDASHGLAASAIGTITRSLPAPGNPSGLSGYIQSVVTEPAYRRRGYARATTQELLAWFNQRGCCRVELHASPAAEPLYRSLGFIDSPDVAMIWRPNEGLRTRLVLPTFTPHSR
ncbi:GNAT family N-acetyltransferase [Carbonactinospora thermoautotrophica]